MFNSRIEEITNYLRCNKVFLPIYKIIAPTAQEEAKYSVEHPTSIDLSSYANEIFYHVNALEIENDRLKAENARYRAALEFLKREYNGFVWRIADKALKGGE